MGVGGAMVRRVVLLLLTIATAGATEAFVHAHLMPVSGAPVPDAVVLVDEGTITAVGPFGEVEIPSDAVVHDLTDKVLIPGLVDLHSHIGGGRLHERLSAVQPGVSAIDAIDPTHPSIQRAQAGGITTANVMPGSGKLMGGQTALLALRDAAEVDDMLLCGEPVGDGPLRRTAICGGVKMATGTNPQGGSGDPASRMGAAFLQRGVMIRGQERVKALDAADGSRRAPAPPKPDLEEDALAQILRGERIVHVHGHRADDIVTAVRLRQEFGFALIVHHGSEGFKVASLLADEDVPVAINVLDTPGGKEETLERRLDNPAILAAAGVRIALITDDPVQDSRVFLRTGGLAIRGGLSEEAALRAMTLTPAELVRIGDRTGSIEVGKEADLAVLSGPPFSTWTHVEQTWVDGVQVYDRADPEQRRFATGGDAAPWERP